VGTQVTGRENTLSWVRVTRSGLVVGCHQLPQAANLHTPLSLASTETESLHPHGVRIGWARVHAPGVWVFTARALDGQLCACAVPRRQKMKSGDTVRCVIPPPEPMEAAPEDIPLDIVYEDDHLIVVNKQAQLVVHPAPGNRVRFVVFLCGEGDDDEALAVAGTQPRSAHSPEHRVCGLRRETSG
jgi:hypothetical protein